ncbi:MAG: hypothetical protein CMM87_03560 [Rickettsiales bacterium]|nr:hypothetical protein [Rickettsiales bacterium]
MKLTTITSILALTLGFTAVAMDPAEEAGAASATASAGWTARHQFDETFYIGRTPEGFNAKIHDSLTVIHATSLEMSIHPTWDRLAIKYYNGPNTEYLTEDGIFALFKEKMKSTPFQEWTHNKYSLNGGEKVTLSMDMTKDQFEEAIKKITQAPPQEIQLGSFLSASIIDAS